MERVSIRPTLDVNGMWGGYTGEGAKTVLPSKAYAKISMRLVANQNSDKISELFTAHFKKIAPANDNDWNKLTSTKSRFVIDGLPEGAKVWVKAGAKATDPKINFTQPKKRYVQ